jgi:hypothetical protein
MDLRIEDGGWSISTALGLAFRVVGLFCSLYISSELAIADFVSGLYASLSAIPSRNGDLDAHMVDEIPASPG